MGKGFALEGQDSVTDKKDKEREWVRARDKRRSHDRKWARENDLKRKFKSDDPMRGWL
jgi:hypothetical protein